MNEGQLRRRIVVPLDLHGVDRNALEILVRIAKQLDRKLLGLLLDNIRLQQAADLPFTTEVNLYSGHETELLRDQLSMRHRHISAKSRSQLNELALSNQVELSFEDASGDRWPTVLQRDGELDIFLPARNRWHSLSPGQQGKSYPISRLGVVLTNSVANTKIIDTTAALLKADLVGDAYLLCRYPPPPEQLQNLYYREHQVRLQADFSCTATAIMSLIYRSPYDLLLLPGECLLDIPATELEAALDKSGGQVLIIY
jgi:hypothetical protein